MNSHTNTVSLRDKIGQMLLMGFDGLSVTEEAKVAKWIKEDKIGGVILFDVDVNTKSARNIESPLQVKNLNHSLQELNSAVSKLPLLIAVDYEGGFVNRLKEKYGFPKTYSAAELESLGFEEAQKAAFEMALTLKESGFNLNFAPLVDVNVNPENPIIGKIERSFSENEFTVTEFAKIYAKQFSEQGILCSYKHFPGHGSSRGDSHLGFVDVSDTFEMRELVPYELLLKENNLCNMIMTAHVVNRQLDATGLPATLSNTILTDLLRKRLNFKGVIITDDMDMKAIADHYDLPKALELALNAGADMFIFGNNLGAAHREPKELIDLIEAKVKSGAVARETINKAYERIVEFKGAIN